MIEQILPNNNERCYSNFSPTFREVNTPSVTNGGCVLATTRACLDPKYFPKFHYAKRRFPITSKCRHIYEVLNVDEIKN
jgi:hypothetical protein